MCVTTTMRSQLFASNCTGSFKLIIDSGARENHILHKTTELDQCFPKCATEAALHDVIGVAQIIFGNIKNYSNCLRNCINNINFHK